MDMQIVWGFSHGSCRCISANVSVGWCLSGRVIAWALSRNERENSACLWALTLALTLALCLSFVVASMRLWEVIVVVCNSNMQ